MHNNALPIALIYLQTDESVYDVIGQTSYFRLSWEILSYLLVLNIPGSKVELRTN